MRVVVVGATGHIGSYLVPRLVRHGHEVVAVSRGNRDPYHSDDAWSHVRRVEADRDAEDAVGRFVGRLIDLRPDAIVDLICFRPSSAEQLVEAGANRLGLLLHCGSIWIHGPAITVPVCEADAREPIDDYGRDKLRIEQILLDATRQGRLRATALHPGHICGPGWAPVNPAGTVDLGVWQRLATGARVALPHLGLETLHHVHADDVAQAFELALDNPKVSVGEAFHVTSSAALTLRGFATAAAQWYGTPARLDFVTWPEFERIVGPRSAAISQEHISHSPSMSIDKARRGLGYRPRFSSLAAVRDALVDLARRGAVPELPSPLHAASGPGS